MNAVDVKKLAVSVFVCGIFGMAIALVIRPTLGWVLAGMLSGSALAYFCYDLRDIATKIPIAWELTCRKIGPPARTFITWAKEPHPFLILWIVPSVSFAILFTRVRADSLVEEIAQSCVVGLAFGAVLLLLCSFGIGKEAEKRKVCWKSEFFFTEKRAHGETLNWTSIPPTYKNIYGLLFSAVRRSIRPTAIKIGKFLLYGWIVCGVLFLRNLFILIHSRGRVASASYCALGILVSCLI